MRIKKRFIQNIIFCLTALVMAWGLKYHYSTAHAENLKWILSPTAALVEWATGNEFYFKADTGYINHDLRIIIAPACAGVNFLIAAFWMSAFCGIIRLYGFSTRCIWLGGCAVGAYAATISVNAVRICFSIAAISADIHAGWLTPQRVHRMTGILIYFFFLSVFYHIIQNIISHLEINKHNRKHIPEKHGPTMRQYRIGNAFPFGILPLVCYWAIAIGIPWLNTAYEKNPAGFTEHILTVGILSFAIFVMIFIIQAAMVQMNIGKDKKPPIAGSL